MKTEEQEPTDFETEKIRDATLSSAPHVNFDQVCHFYYDETNNFGKVYITQEEFNVSIDSNFVLGGIIDNEELIEFEEFRKSLKLQANVNELKFKNIATGSFTDCLKSWKLKMYLEFIKDSEFDVHFSSLNILYFGIVDIVDSAIINDKSIFDKGPQFINKLKDVIYQVIRKEIEKAQQIFFSYNYPNIKGEDLENFATDLFNLLKDYKEDEEFSEYLKVFINAVNDSEELVFIQDEEDLQLIKDFSHFYLRPIYLFNKATHTFDEENVIEKIIKKYKLLYKSKELSKYSFVKSKDSILIQLSDIFVGICGKLSNFIITKTTEEITAEFEKMNHIQKENLKLYFQLIYNSREKNPGFVHWTSPVSEIIKAEHLERLSLS